MIFFKFLEQNYLRNGKLISCAEFLPTVIQ